MNSLSTPHNRPAGKVGRPPGTKKLVSSGSAVRPGDATAVLDDLVWLAALLAHVPVAAVALTETIDTGRFQASIGLAPAHEPAAYALQQRLSADQPGGLHEVADLTKYSNLTPYLGGALADAWQFGATLSLLNPNGLTVGVLVLLGTLPGCLSDAQKDGLHRLARLAVARLTPTAETVPNGVAPPTTARPEVFIKQDQRLVRLPAADIYYVEALGDYVNLYTESLGRVTIYATMKQMELKLPIAHFARVHRKYIAQLDRILAIDGDVLQLATHQAEQPAEIAIGNSYKANLLNRLNIL